MKLLYVLFDSRCGLCRRVRQWLEAQPAWVEMRFLAAGSEEAQRLFPTISRAAEELTVVNDEGEVYSGNQGWIMCLWALTEYRELAYKLSSPLMLPLARSAFAALSAHRHQISEMLKHEKSEREIVAVLNLLPPESCEISGGER